MATQVYKYSRKQCNKCGKTYLQCETDGTNSCKHCGSENIRQIEGTLVALNQQVTGDWPKHMAM